MVDHRIDLRNHGRLRKPPVDNHVRRYAAVLVEVVANVDQRTYRHAADRSDQLLQQIYVSGAQRSEAHVEQRLVLVGLELGNDVRRLLAHAALEVLELARRQPGSTPEAERARLAP